MSAMTAIIDRAERGDATIRDGYAILERMQQELDILNEKMDALENQPIPHDPRIVIRSDDNPKLYRFSTIDAFADWLVKGYTE